MRMEVILFEITFTAAPAGTIKHIVKRPSEEAALCRIRAAYPGQTLTIHSIRRNVRVRDINYTRAESLKADLEKTKT